MTPIEKAYEKFKNRNDKTKMINGKVYYRIVYSDYFNIPGRERGILTVIPSPDMPKKVGAVYQDEKGNHFTFRGMTHIRFIGDIPKWYFKCGECSMEWQETQNIGKYLTIME